MHFVLRISLRTGAVCCACPLPQVLLAEVIKKWGDDKFEEFVKSTQVRCEACTQRHNEVWVVWTTCGMKSTIIKGL